MPRTIKADGRTIVVPDDATDDEINQIVGPAPAATSPEPSFTQRVQNSFDTNTKTSPNEPLLQTGLKSVVGAIGAPFIHPLKTAEGVINMLPDNPDYPHLPMTVNGQTKAADMPGNPLIDRGIQAYHDYKDGGLPYAGTKLGGEILGGVALGEAGGAATSGLGTAVDATRNAAIGDTNAAALRGLQIGPRSPKALRTLSAVEGARPFLQGATSLEDLQAKIPDAKAEIWSPYKQAVEAIGDKHTGFGSIADLEDQRLQTSALLRDLKSRSPEAIQLAQQKGLTQADLLAQEKQLKALLDPELRSTGIDPTAIRKTFGDVSRIGSQISGKSTLVEADKPYGFGKMVNLDLHKPLQAPGQIIEGLRDIAAGRPLYKGKPTDIGIREGFRNAGPKPDLGRILTPEEQANPFINKSRLKSAITQ